MAELRQSNHFEASLRGLLQSGMVGSWPSWHDNSPPSTRTSTPSPPCIVGTASHGTSPLSSGEHTPPGRESVQLFLKIMEAQKGSKIPLKPGLVDESKMPWPMPLPGPPGLPPPPPAALSRPAGQLAPAQPLMPPSTGSVGHPNCCNEACKYVKRKTGCMLGAACPQCHLCFWQRTAVVTARSSATESAAISCVADFAGKQIKPPAQEAESETLEKAVVRDSLGSRGHPETCAEACRYIQRKGGCRNGSSCPDCHFCTWRRNPAKAQSQQAGLEEKTEAGFGFSARKHLQRLIRIQLDAATSPAGEATARDVSTTAPIADCPNEAKGLL